MNAVPFMLRRFSATAIDFLVVPLVSLLVMLISGVMEGVEAYVGYQTWIRGISLGVVGYLVVNGWLLFARGQTLGKGLMRLAIVTPDGQRPSMGRLFVRGLFFPWLYLPLFFATFGGFVLLPIIDLAIGLRKDRRCLHDLVAGTVVQVRYNATQGSP